MKLKAGEDKEGDENKTLDIMTNSLSSNGKYDKRDLKTANSSSKSMGKTKDKNGEVCVEDLVNAVKDCKIGEDHSTADAEITGGLVKLTLKDDEEDSIKVKQEPVTRRILPKKDSVESDDDVDNNAKVDSKNQRKEDDSSEALVKLEAPDPDDYDEEESENADSASSAQDEMTERGPAYGVAANSNYNGDSGLGYIASKPYLAYGGQMPAMPQNFPNYNRNQNVAAAGGASQGMGGKRSMEEREVYYEPQKFVRPQDAGLAMAGDMAAMMGTMNNLNAPGNGAGMVAPGGAVNGKKVTAVYNKQMSGGTMYDNVQVSAEQIMNGMTASGVYPVDNYQQNMNNSGYQQSHGTMERQDSIGLPDLWDLPEGTDLNNPPLDVEDFFPSDSASNTMTQGQVVAGQYSNVQMNVNARQQQNQQGPLPPMSSLTNSLNNYSQQKQQQQLFAEHGNGKRGSFGSTFDDGGYASDLSPSHEMQFSPNPSPRSAIDASPATMNGSPPRTNWSPPPSNMSNYSADSGVCSPMSEDQSNGYTTQVKSPHQTHVMSPSNQGRVASTSPPHHQMTSPPHQMMSPAHQMMSPAHQMMSPAHQMMSPAHQMMSPPHQSVSPVHQAHSPPQVVPQTPRMADPGSPGDVYTSSYIDENLDELKNVLQITDTILKTPELADAVSGPYQSRWVDEHLEDLDCALQIASEDLMEQQQQKAGARKVCAPKGNMTTAPPTSVVQSHMGKPAVSYPANGMKTVAPQPTAVMTNMIKPENIPSTVPTTISPVTKNSTTINGSKGQQKGKFNSVPVTFSGAVVITSAGTLTTQPSVNSAGKIAIPNLQSKSKPPQQQQMLPVIVTGDGVMAPVIIMPPQNVAPKTTQRFTPIAPKDPTKQGEKAGDVKGKSGASGSGDPPNGGKKVANGAAQNGKKTPQTATLLNLARRVVAERNTEELKFKDKDLDTILHVAVCRADCYMVQALLERLVRENLVEMIDAQNSAKQTPLYLAVSTKNAEMVRLLVEQGADVNPFAESTSARGTVEKFAAIHCASCRGEKYLDTLKALLKAPEINLNQVNSDGHTALHCAILAHGKIDIDGHRLNSIPIIQTLIHAGADPNLQVQQSGKTALMYAMESRDLDLIENTFQLVEPSKLPAYLKTLAFDGSSCQRIFDSFKSTLDPASQQRLQTCLRTSHSRGYVSSSSSSPTSSQS